MVFYIFIFIDLKQIAENIKINPNVGVAFDANDKSPITWIRDNPTGLELFHESMYLEDLLEE